MCRNANLQILLRTILFKKHAALDLLIFNLNVLLCLKASTPFYAFIMSKVIPISPKELVSIWWLSAAKSHVFSNITHAVGQLTVNNCRQNSPEQSSENPSSYSLNRIWRSLKKAKENCFYNKSPKCNTVANSLRGEPEKCNAFLRNSLAQFKYN